MRDELRATFFAESEDLLAAMSEGLEVMAAGATDAETVNAVFRAVHSIKGAAGAFALSEIVSFAHSFETVLDALRSDRLPGNPNVIHVLQRSGDALAELLEMARDGRNGAPEALAGLLDRLEELASGDEESPEDFVFQPLELVLPPEEPEPDRADYQIRIRPWRQFYANGHEPAHLFNALADLGDLEVTCDVPPLPPLERLDPEEGHLAWTLRLGTAEPEERIREVFAFVEGLCDLAVEALASLPAASGPAPRPVEPATPTMPSAALSASRPAPTREAPRPTIRVDLDRVDRLINCVGELIVSQAVIGQKVAEAGLPTSSPLASHVEELSHLAREIQESVMSIRAQPVKPLFQRMARVVREAADSTGKQVELILVGEETEVDRTVVEGLADPLTHMVRNAVDHGIESPEERAAKGKPPMGQLTLAASHVSGNVRIVVQDDGAGLDRARIRATAVRKGLVAGDTILSEAEVDNLLFLPGFSTAASVTNLSGRGVGMDVARTAIITLGGRIGISSQPGEGTTFVISLPLTLAVLDGVLVRVAGQDLVLPAAAVVETLRPRHSAIVPLSLDRHCVALHDHHLPVLDLAPLLGFGPGLCLDDALLIVVRTSSDDRLALAVEAISDKRQVVIKSLKEHVGRVPGVSAATILGDGKVALILDPDALADLGACPPRSGSQQPLEASDAHAA